jgi:hypothetical protein
MDQSLKEKLSAKSKWIRFVYMLFFLVVTFIVKLILWFITAFQFVVVLFTDHPNKIVLDFGDHLSNYIYQIFRFLSYNSDEKPFPFQPWVTNHGSIQKRETPDTKEVEKRKTSTKTVTKKK